MNEYTRREEVRWTLIASLALVLCIAPAVILLVTAKGRSILDPAARKTATEAAEKVPAAHACAAAADKLSTEIEVFKSSAKAAHLDAPDEAPPDPKQKKTLVGRVKQKVKEKTDAPDVSFAWPAAQPSQKAAKQLAPCRTDVEATAGTSAAAAPAWDAIAKAATVAPAAGDKNDEVASARSLLKLLSDIPIDKVVSATHDAETAVKTKADDLDALAGKTWTVEPIPDGLIPRRLAVGIGVGLSVIALLLSYLSVRVSSNRRLSTLIPLREAAKHNQPGIHAAAVLRLASQPNGGLPGGVIGGAFGGLVAAAAQRTDTDVFIIGVMSGFLLGLALQYVFRLAVGASRWRQRATELADIEKPAIPIVLALSGVNPGLEAPFITFFNGLAPQDAASTVEKLAAQAEEKILAAADAGAAARGGGMPPGMMPPGH